MIPCPTICPIVQPKYTLIRTEAPLSDPLTPQEAKDWLRIGSDREINTMAALIKAATGKLDAIDGILNPSRCLMKQTWAMTLDGFPAGDLIIPLVPVKEISALTYLDGDGAEQEIDGDAYQLIADDWSARLVLPSGGYWPTPTENAGSVSIEIVAGYDSLPPLLRQDVLTLVGYWFDNRTMTGQLPPGWTSVYRRPVVA